MFSTISYLSPNNKRQQSVNNFRPSIFENQRAVQAHCSVINLSRAFLDNRDFDNVVLYPKMSVNTASTERQRFLILHL